MVERAIPADAVEARMTPMFDALSVPKALLAAHHTTVWAELVCTNGSVRFIEEDSAFKADATPGQPVVVVPNVKHRIVPSADALFFVRFYSVGLDG